MANTFNHNGKVVITDGGNVGIGTTSPTQKLEVIGRGYFSTGLSAGTTSTAGAGLTVGGSAVFLGFTEVQQGNSAYFYSSGNTYNSTIRQQDDNLVLRNTLYINGNGNVGIGTTSPAQKLDVSGNIQATTGLILTGNAAKVSTTYSGVTVTNFFTDANGGVISVDGSNRISLRQGGVSGTDAITIAGSGNVGIGTTSPSEKLHIYGTSNQIIKIENSGTYLMYLGLVSNEGYIGSTNATPLTFYTNNVNRMYINTSGNIGIGTTAPESKLHIAGGDVLISNGQYYTAESTTGGNYKLAGLTSGNVIVIGAIDYTSAGTIFAGGDNVSITTGGVAGSSRIYINSTGNVGIGTTSPAYKLDVAGTISNNSAQNIIYASYDAVAALFQRVGTYGSVIQIGRSGVSNSTTIDYPADGTFAVSTAGSERMRITAAGNVGIGTTSPTNKLQVTGGRTYLETGNEIYTLGISRSGANAYYLGVSNSSSPDLYFSNNAGTTRVTLTDAGNVGIGTTAPQVKLEVRGAQDNTIVPANAVAKFVGGDAGIFVGNLAGTPNYGAWLQAMRESDGLVFPLHLQPNGGNVGIGTNSPAQKLHVVGNGLYTGNLDVGHSVSTGDAAINLGTDRTDSGYAYLDLIGDTTYSDYGLRIIRGNAGANAASDITHRGTGDFGINTVEAAALKFRTANVERMRITAAGNVGIGTTAPGAKLHVDGGNAIFNNGSADTILAIETDAAGLYDPIFQMGSGQNTIASEGFEIWYANNVGDVHLSTTYNDAAASIRFHTATGASKSTSNERMIITGAGNVGIGTTSPSSLLDVYNGSGWGAVDIDGISGGEIRLQKNGTTYGNLYASDNSSTAFVINAAQVTDLILQTNSSERLRITAAGNVGIGTTSPGYKLDVTGDINFTSTLKFGGVNVIHGTFADIYANIRVIRNASTSVSDGMYIGYDNSGGASGHLRFFANGTNERMRIDASTGNVGIGTTAPSKKFVVRSADNTTNTFAGFYAENESQGVEIWYAGIQAGGSNGNVSLHLASKGTGDVLVTNGNVGIGTTSPSYKLEVVGGSVNTQIARFITADHPAHSIGLGVDAQGTNWGASIFQDDIKRFTVESNGGILVGGNYQGSDAPANGAAIEGNVGIGTSSPGAKLDVAGDIRLGGTATYNSVSVYNNSASGGGGYLAYQNGVVQAFFGAAGWYTGTTDTGVVIGTDSSSRPIRFYTDTERMRITGDGNVGIGTTSPAVKLHVVGTESRFGGVASGYISVYNANSRSGYLQANEGSDFRIASDTNDMTFYVNGSERMRITAAGNVGIGTTSPSTNLHVAGSVRVSGNNTNRLDLDGGVRITGQYYANGNTEYTYIDMYNNANASINIGTKHPLSYISFESGNGAYTERMRITNTGNVGIGTTAPVTQLQVTSATNAVDVLRIGNTAGDSGSVQGVTHLAINHFNAGTNPSTRITAYQDGVSGWPGGMYFSTRSLNTDSAPVERMRITSGGNVGIGTTSPSNILHITNVMRMDNATGNAPAVTSYTPRNGYGDVETERCLADPAVWLKINIGGTEYVIPAYTQA